MPVRPIAAQPAITEAPAIGRTAAEEKKLSAKLAKASRTTSRLAWQAPTFYFNPQKRYLSLVVLGLMAGAVAMFVMRYDTLTAVTTALASLVLLLYSNQKPTSHQIVVDHTGIRIGDAVYRYPELRSFWIHYIPGGPKELSLESTRWYKPYVKIQLADQNPIELRSLLISFLPEKEHEESLADVIGRKLGL